MKKCMFMLGILLASSLCTVACGEKDPADELIDVWGDFCEASACAEEDIDQEEIAECKMEAEELVIESGACLKEIVELYKCLYDGYTCENLKAANACEEEHYFDDDAYYACIADIDGLPDETKCVSVMEKLTLCQSENGDQ